MKILRILSMLLGIIMFTMLASVGVSMLTGVAFDTVLTILASGQVLIIGLVLFTKSKVPAIGNFAFNNVVTSPLTVAFANEIAENLFPDNSYYKNSKDDSAFISYNPNGGKATVALPQAGALPGVSINRTVLPAVPAKRTDTVASYDIDEFTTDPVIIQLTEEMMVSYAKRQSIVSDAVGVLSTTIADKIGQDWMPTGASRILRTTGALAAPTAPSATGQRRLITKDEIIAAATALTIDNMPEDGRFMAVPAYMYAQLQGIPSFIDYQNRGLIDLQASGWIGEIFGFKVFKRGYLPKFDNTGTPVKKAFGAAAAASDNEAVLCWHKSAVRRAEGSVRVDISEYRPEYYGHILSGIVHTGGIIARTDSKGVIAIVQAAS